MWSFYSTVIKPLNLSKAIGILRTYSDESVKHFWTGSFSFTIKWTDSDRIGKGPLAGTRTQDARSTMAFMSAHCPWGYWRRLVLHCNNPIHFSDSRKNNSNVTLKKISNWAIVIISATELLSTTEDSSVTVLAGYLSLSSGSDCPG